MKRIMFAAALLAVSACSSTGEGPPASSGPPAGFSEEAMSGGRYRITYTSATAMAQAAVADRTLARAAQLTLDKGEEWFEIAAKTDGKNTQTLVIVMGSGESLAGGPKQYNAKTTLASLKGKIG